MNLHLSATPLAAAVRVATSVPARDRSTPVTSAPHIAYSTASWPVPLPISRTVLPANASMSSSSRNFRVRWPQRARPFL